MGRYLTFGLLFWQLRRGIQQETMMMSLCVYVPFVNQLTRYVTPSVLLVFLLSLFVIRRETTWYHIQQSKKDRDKRTYHPHPEFEASPSLPPLRQRPQRPASSPREPARSCSQCPSWCGSIRRSCHAQFPNRSW